MSFLWSILFAMSLGSILSPYFCASFTTGSGNFDGSLYSFINDSMSTPASFGFPNISIIFPSAFLSFFGYFVISTNTLCPSLAFPKFVFEMNISVPKFLSSGTTNPKFRLF